MTSHDSRLLVSRRGLLGLAGLGALGAAAAFGLSGCVARPPATRLRVAGGEAGGLYQEFATLLADALTRHDVAEHSEALVSEASRENIELIVAGEADLGLALLDTVAASDEVAGGDVVAIGRIYQNYFHCVVRRDGPVRTVADLSGRVVATGAPGSGTRLTGGRILEAAGLTGPAAPSQDLRLGLNDGLQALERGDVDAMMISGGIPIGSITALNERLGLRLLDLSSVLPELRHRYPGVYEQGVVPEHTYAGTDTIGTVGVANLLLCRPDLDDRVVAEVVELLIEHAGALVPASSAGIQFLSPETLISTGGQPLHPAAAEAYRRFHG
ncbi:C4-dicarboxylate ABC transporter substrate-binding protein [Leucobacter sp. Psy1]|uniref:TAXI family TRAP transporter solute-binding subunit n=1 Tax=Leucobacter sp. Psy1 TaxID=2875729 RepID=UPI001CD7D845|nr:TAXI family TRAP transporter solute-binding subunit [Leucobacter sp. Psy1]UBH06654.1 C4-dicarboxylate ABC transporter substrate-binding protein [Leucobacter sp. Psy1]